MRFEKVITAPLGPLNGKICRLSILESTFVYSLIVLVNDHFDVCVFWFMKASSNFTENDIHKQADVISLNYRS